LKALKIVANGDVVMSVEGDMTFEIATNLLSGNFEIGSIDMAPIVFFLGPVPVVINAVIPIKAGYSVDIALATTTKLVGSAAGTIAYGVQYDPKEKDFHWIHDNQISHTGNLAYVSTKAKVTVTAYLLPILALNIDYIGGPNIAFQPSLEAIFGVEPSNPTCTVSVALSWGFRVTLGAQILIKFAGSTLFEKFTTPLTIWSIKRPITSGCAPLGPIFNGAGVKNNGIFLGSTWAGNQQRDSGKKCSKYPIGLISYQLVQNNTDSFIFASNSNFRMDDGSACVSQILWETSVNGLSVSLTPVHDGDSKKTHYAYCEGSNLPILVTSATGGFATGTFDSLLLTSPDGCISTSLQRK